MRGLGRGAGGGLLSSLLGEDPGGCKGFRTDIRRVLGTIGRGKSRTMFRCARGFSKIELSTRRLLMARRRVTRTCRRMSSRLVTVVEGTLIGVESCRRGRVRCD